MDENGKSKIVVNSAIHIHRTLGPGLLESVYQRILAYELRKAGLEIETEAIVPVHWDGHSIDESFRADIIANGKVLLELKSIEQLHPAHKKQVRTYLRLSEIKLGMLLNFGTEVMKDGIHRIVNGLPDIR